MKRMILAVVAALTIFAAPTAVTITAGQVAPDAGIELDSAAAAHNYYTCRRDFHVHNGWFVRYLGWYWKYRDGAWRQVYRHGHEIWKPYSYHTRDTWCT